MSIEYLQHGTCYAMSFTWIILLNRVEGMTLWHSRNLRLGGVGSHAHGHRVLSCGGVVTDGPDRTLLVHSSSPLLRRAYSGSPCLSFLGLPSQMTTNWVASEIEIHFAPVLEDSLKPRCLQGCGPREPLGKNPCLPLPASGGSRHPLAYGFLIPISVSHDLLIFFLCLSLVSLLQRHLLVGWRPIRESTVSLSLRFCTELQLQRPCFPIRACF